MDSKKFINLNEEQLTEWLKSFLQFYKFDSCFATYPSRPNVLGNKSNKVCRFCKKNSSETTFKKTAHIIPKLFGNIDFKCHYECDKCNQIFSKYETDLANFIGIRRFFEYEGNYGKKRRIIYKSPSGESEIYSSVRGMEINDLKNEIFETIEDGKTQRSKILKYPYSPLGVYKAFVKMCISSLTDESMVNYRKTINFLLTNKLDEDVNIKRFGRLFHFNLFDHYFEYPIIYLFQKKFSNLVIENDPEAYVPQCTFLILSRWSIYQIFIPFDLSDKIDSNEKNSKIALPFAPPLITDNKFSRVDIAYRYDYEMRDLSIIEKVRNEKDEFYIKFSKPPIILTYNDVEHAQLVEKYKLRR